jgi:hypothetical protein
MLGFHRSNNSFSRFVILVMVLPLDDSFNQSIPGQQEPVGGIMQNHKSFDENLDCEIHPIGVIIEIFDLDKMRGFKTALC